MIFQTTSMDGLPNQPRLLAFAGSEPSRKLTSSLDHRAWIHVVFIHTTPKTLLPVLLARHVGSSLRTTTLCRTSNAATLQVARSTLVYARTIQLAWPTPRKRVPSASRRGQSLLASRGRSFGEPQLSSTQNQLGWRTDR